MESKFTSQQQSNTVVPNVCEPSVLLGKPALFLNQNDMEGQQACPTATLHDYVELKVFLQTAGENRH